MGKNVEKVLSCLVIGMLLMSVVPVSVFASANSNISSDGVNLTQSTPQSNAKSLKEGIHILSPDLVLTRADYNMSIAVEDVEGMGRYTEATAEGKKLLYGYPDAGTSYTTIRIDGNDYYQDTTMDLYVTQVPTIIGEDSIVTKWTLPPNVNVSQDLTLMRNTTRYRLTVTNNDHASHRVKIRYMFDTMLAYNDGAPFRVPGVGDITTEQEFIPIFDYWKAMDSLANPTLTSNCTFVPGNKPYKVQFAYWGDIYDVPFDYVIEAGQSITRDTAVGMYWDIGTLVPRETKDVIVYYGTAFVNITDIEIIELSTEFGNYLPGQNVRGYAYIGNGGNVPLVNGQLAINVTNPKDEVVFENLSTITINPDQTISRSFTYNLPVDALGGVYTINATIYDAEMNLLHQRVASFSVTAINLSISPESITTSIGGSAKYEITVKNPSDIAVSLNLSLTGLNDSWYTLSRESLILNAGEEEVIILNVTVPESPDNVGEYRFNVFADAKSESAVLNVGLEPVIYELSPPNNVILSSNDIIFSWKTSVDSATELYIKSETEADFTQVIGESGLDHSVTVENLTRNMNYTWYIKSCSAFGCAISENRIFYIDNGIVFTQDVYEFNIERDYNQHCFVSVKNADSEAHDLLVRAFNPYDDLYFGFIGHGSADRIISLASDETKDIELVIHAQDAMLENYTFTVNLTNLGAENITDYALVRVNVRHPHIDFNITEVSTDPITLSKTIRVTNYGDPVTDLSITPDEKLKGKVMIQPSLAHCSLGTGESVDMVISPIWSEGIRYIHGTIAATVADESKELFVDYSCPEGKEMYPITLDHPILYFDLKGAWCINCHHVEDTFNLPPGFGSENVVYSYIGMELNAGSGQTRPYNVYIGINGHRVGTLSNTFPRGYYEFDIDSSYLNYATAGIAENKYTLDTDMPGSYYTPLSNVQVVMCLDELKLHICAENEEQAEEIAWSAPYIHKPSESITVNILSPEEGSTLNQNQPVLIKAEVLGDSEGEELCKVIATFNNSDEEIVLVDNGLHGDGQADDGVYANTWTPRNAGGCEITVNASNCVANGLDSVNVTIGNLPDLTLSPDDIIFSTPNPVIGEKVTITATIHNIGMVEASNIIVQFFDDNPIINGTQIGEDQTINLIVSGETKTVNVTWIAENGFHFIYVWVDPSNLIQESNEENNLAFNVSGLKLSVIHPSELAIGIPLEINVSINTEAEITAEIGDISETKIGDAVRFVMDTKEFESRTYNLTIKIEDIECYTSEITFYDPETLQELISELNFLDNTANAELLQISGVPAGCTMVLIKDLLLDVAGGYIKDVLDEVIGNFRTYLDSKLGEWMQNFANELINAGFAPDEANDAIDCIEGIIGTIEDQAQDKLEEQKDNTVDSVISDIENLIKIPIRDAIYELLCKSEMDKMKDRTSQFKKDIPTLTEDELSEAKRIIRVGKGAIENTDDEMIYSLEIGSILGHEIKAEPSINYFEDRFELAIDPPGWDIPFVGFVIDPGALIDICVGAGQSILTVPAHLGWIEEPTPDDEKIEQVEPKAITIIAIIIAIKKIIAAINILVEASSYIIFGGTFISTPLLAEEVNEEHADTINAVNDILGAQRVYSQAPMLQMRHLNGRTLSTSPTNIVILSADGKILEFEHIKHPREIIFPLGEYKVVGLSKEPEVIEIKDILKEIEMEVKTEKNKYQVEEKVNITVNITNNMDQKVENANFFMMITPGNNTGNNTIFSDMVSIYENSFLKLKFNMTTKHEGVSPISAYLMMLDEELAVNGTSFIVGEGDFEGAELRISYEKYYDPGNVTFNVTINNIGTVTLNPILEFNNENIIMGELQVGQCMSEEIELLLSDPGEYSYIFKVLNNESILDIETISFFVRAKDVLFASIGTNKVIYSLGDEVNITTKAYNITLNEVDVPVNLNIATPSGEVINTSQFIPKENGTYIVRAIPVAEGCVVHEDELFFFVEEQSDIVMEICGNATFDNTSTLIVRAKTDLGGAIDGVSITIGNITQLTGSEAKFVIDPKEAEISIRAQKTGFNPDIKSITVTMETTPPTIINIKPGNIIAASGDIVNFSCFVTDDTGVESVWLEYTTNNRTTPKIKIMDNPYNDFYTTNLTLPTCEALEYKIKASDKTGNIGNTSIYAIKVLPTVIIELKEGWNMISLPLKPANLSASAVLQTIPNPAEDKFYIWNASKGEYDAIFGDRELELGRAYRINITANGTWRLSGTETHGVQVNLTRGRNMIGVPSPANTSATDINITVGTDTCNLVEAAKKGYIGGIFYSWNAANGNYDALVILSPGAKLMPDIGYFANVNHDCTITYP